METQKQNKLIEYIPYLIPVVGVVLFGWSTIVILFYFCVENLLRGLFFVIRGLVMVFRGGGVAFLILFSLLYFTHATLVFQGVFASVPESFLKSVPSLLFIGLNILILLVPHIFELRTFIGSVGSLEKITLKIKEDKLPNKEIGKRIKNEDLAPLLDFVFDVKEMFGRIALLWFTIAISSVVLFFTQFVVDSRFTDGIVMILIFSLVHYKFENFARKERQKVWNKHIEWQKKQKDKEEALKNTI